MTENKTGKPAFAPGRYIKYAIGEIFLVVIGILIALWLNNLNSQRIQNEKEKELLLQLASDLQRGISDMTMNVKEQDKGIRAAEFVLEHMDSGKPYVDSIGEHIAKSFIWSKLILDLGAYETIKSQGLEIIRNKELRSLIVDKFEGELYFHKELEDQLEAYSEKMRTEYGAKYFKSSFKGLRYISGSGLYSGVSEPRDYEKLRKDIEFRYHLETFLNTNMTFQLISNRPYRQRLIDLRNQILIEVGEEITEQ